MMKSKTIYKIITTITLIAPVSIYLFLSATLFNIDADITIKNAVVSDLIVDGSFIYTNNENVVYNGSIASQDNHYGFYVDEDTIIKTDDGYFNYELEEISALTIRKEMSYRLPIAFIVSAFGIGIAYLIISKRMQWYKSYPRVSALVGLITITLVFWMLDIIIGNMMYVFLVATLSWAMYCVEYMFNQGLINDKDKAKSDSDLLRTLKELSNG